MTRRNTSTPRNFHIGEYYVERNKASADAFPVVPSGAAQHDVAAQPTDQDITPLDAAKTARDLGRVDEGWGTTPATKHAATKTVP